MKPSSGQVPATLVVQLGFWAIKYFHVTICDSAMGKSSYSEPDQLKIKLLMLLGFGIIEFFCYSDAISH